MANVNSPCTVGGHSVSYVNTQNHDAQLREPLPWSLPACTMNMNMSMSDREYPPAPAPTPAPTPTSQHPTTSLFSAASALQSCPEAPTTTTTTTNINTTTTTTTTHSEDVIALLIDQHEQLRGLFEAIAATTGDHRRELFVRMQRLLALHEAAEDTIVHPACRTVLPDSDAVVEARMHEEVVTGVIMTALGAMDPDTPEFEATFDDLKKCMWKHFDAEERDEFPRLRDTLPSEQLAAFAARIERVIEPMPNAQMSQPQPTAVAPVAAPPAGEMCEKREPSFTASRHGLEAGQ